MCVQGEREGEGETSLTVTQPNAAGQDGGGEGQKGGGDEEREEIQDGEEGGRLSHKFKPWLSCLCQGFLVCMLIWWHFLPAVFCISITKKLTGQTLDL